MTDHLKPHDPDDLDWINVERTTTRRVIQITRDNALALARDFGWGVFFTDDGNPRGIGLDTHNMYRIGDWITQEGYGTHEPGVDGWQKATR